MDLWDAFGNRFAFNIYEAGRNAVSSWQLVSDSDVNRPSDRKPLAHGQWREFIGWVKQAGLWELPATLLADPEVETDYGEWAGLSGEKYHKPHREGDWTGLLQRMRFLNRLSGFFQQMEPTLPVESLSSGRE